MCAFTREKLVHGTHVRHIALDARGFNDHHASATSRPVMVQGHATAHSLSMRWSLPYVSRDYTTLVVVGSGEVLLLAQAAHLERHG